MGQIISSLNENNINESHEYNTLYNDYLKMKSKHSSQGIKINTIETLNKTLEDTISKLKHELDNTNTIECNLVDSTTTNSELEEKLLKLNNKNSELECVNKDLVINNTTLKTQLTYMTKTLNINENKLKLCEESNKSYNENIKLLNNDKTKYEKDVKLLHRIIDYYTNNMDVIISYILKRNNTIVPDMFEKKIMENTYKTIFELINNNIKDN